MFSFRKNKPDAPRRRQAAGDERRERAAEQDRESQQYLFRRNRTLTGSSSSRVAATVEHSGDLQSARTQAHHLTIQRRKLSGVLGGVLAVMAILCATIYNVTAFPVASSSEALNINSQRYERAIDEYLSRHPSERLRPLLNEQRLNEYIRQVVPEVDSVIQEGFASIGGTRFELTMRKPIASWILSGKQYFVDEKGISFEKNYFETPVVSVIDQSGVEQAPGAAVASSRFLTFVGRVVAEAKKYNLVVERAVIPLGTTRQLEVRVQGRGYPIKLSLDRSPAVQIEDMSRVVGYFDSRRQTPQFVDVRVSGKAYYK